MRRRPRSAYTLIELAVAMSVAALIATIAITQIVLLIRASDGGRQHLLATHSLGRLQQTLQDDLTLATEINVSSGDDWQINLAQEAGQTTAYLPLADGIQRKIYRDGALAGQDVIVLPGWRGSELTVESTEDAGSVLQLTLLPSEERIGGSPPLTRPQRTVWLLSFPSRLEPTMTAAAVTEDAP